MPAGHFDRRRRLAAGAVACLLFSLFLCSTPSRADKIALKDCDQVVAFLSELLPGRVRFDGLALTTHAAGGCRAEASGVRVFFDKVTFEGGGLWLEMLPGDFLGEPAVVVTWGLPEQIVARNGEGRVTIALQLAQGPQSLLWHSGSGQLVGVDIDLRDIKAILGPYSLSLERLSYRNGIQTGRRTPETVDMVDRILVRELEFKPLGARRSLQLASLIVDSDVWSLPPAFVRSLFKRLGVFATLTDRGEVAPEDLLAFFDMIAEVMEVETAEARTALRVNRLIVPRGLFGEGVYLRQFAVTASLDRGGAESLDYELHASLDMPDIGEGRVAPLAPERAEIRLRVAGIPVGFVLHQMRELVALAAGGPPPGAKPDPEALSERFLEAARAAGMRAEILDTWAESPEYRVDARGAFEIAEESVEHAIGEMRFDVENLPTIVQRVGETRPAEDDKTMARLTLLQALGQQSEAEDGSPVHSYVIALDGAGRVTLNGADLKTLLGAAPQ